jgi:hypothetical protein
MPQEPIKNKTRRMQRREAAGNQIGEQNCSIEPSWAVTTNSPRIMKCSRWKKQQP